MAGYAYATVADLLAVLPASQQSIPPVRLLRILEAASEAVDGAAGRTFRTYEGVEYVESDGEYVSTLSVPDVLSLSAVDYDDAENGLYSTNLAATNWSLWRRRPGGPYVALRLLNGLGFVRGTSIRLTGRFGYQERTVATGATVTGVIDQDDMPTSSNPTLTPVGQTMRVEGEQMFVRVAGTPLTVDRGANGSAAVGHGAGTAILAYDYPPAVVEACLAVARRRTAPAVPAGLSSESFGDLSFSYRDPNPAEEWALVKSILPPHLVRESLVA